MFFANIVFCKFSLHNHINFNWHVNNMTQTKVRLGPAMFPMEACIMIHLHTADDFSHQFQLKGLTRKCHSHIFLINHGIWPKFQTFSQPSWSKSFDYQESVPKEIAQTEKSENPNCRTFIINVFQIFNTSTFLDGSVREDLKYLI